VHPDITLNRTYELLRGSPCALGLFRPRFQWPEALLLDRVSFYNDSQSQSVPP
jgi:hypothetical protein